MRHTFRRAYTLLEVLLALAIASVLLGGLYVAINVQLRHAQAGRDTIEQSALVRNLFHRMNADVAGAINLSDAARYRRNQNGSNSGQGGSNSGSSGSSSGTSGSGTANSGTSGASGSSQGGSGTSGTSGSSSSSSSSGASGSSTSSTGNVVVIPQGVQGDEDHLVLYVSKYPREVYGNKPDEPGTLTSDLRRITYWLAGENQGLARQEVKVISSNDADPNNLPTGNDVKPFVLAPEVRALRFSYFDGTTWQSSWDATTLGTDGVTPIGPPRAVAIEVEIARSSSLRKGEPLVASYRHVIAIASANGATQQPTTQQGGGSQP